MKEGDVVVLKKISKRDAYFEVRELIGKRFTVTNSWYERDEGFGWVGGRFDYCDEPIASLKGKKWFYFFKVKFRED
jgi:hypothetical protein